MISAEDRAAEDRRARVQLYADLLVFDGAAPVVSVRLAVPPSHRPETHVVRAC